MNLTRLILLTACSSCIALSAVASEKRVVYGTVLAVEPVTEVRLHEPEHAACHQPKPQQADLAVLLSWDLAADCRVRRTERTRHYRVEYAWDGRKHTHLMYERPPRRIPLLLTID